MVIHDGTLIGEGARIQDGAVLGKQLALGPASRAPRGELPPLELGEGATVGANAVVAAGSRIGPGAVLGDRAHLRERSAFERAPNAGGLPSTAPSCTVTPAPSAVPAWITTLPPIQALSGSVTPSPSKSPGARSDCRSTRALLERALERLQHAHHAQAALAARARLPTIGDALDEMTALDPQRLLVGDVR